MTFRACRVFTHGPPAEARIVTMSTDELAEGDVVVQVAHSSLNYKDALAVTGRGRILRRLPLTPGIDLAGIVQSSTDARFVPETAVIANGMGLGETHDGGFGELARLPADWLMPLPPGLTLGSAMALGTAGYTAALALHRMEVNGQQPAMGPVVVTGATGGVGAVAVRLLSKKGYAVIAVSGRREHHDWIRNLGASEVVTADDLALSEKPLDRARFGGVIDNVGGGLIARLLSHVAEWGTVVSVGLAGGAELHTTVFPFILRGVSLLGASSANSPMSLRTTIWHRLGDDLSAEEIDAFVTREIGLEGIAPSAIDLLERRLVGRTLVTPGLR